MGTAKRNLASAALKSLSTEDIAAYLDYNYIPFKKTQCVGRIFIVLLSGAGLCRSGNGACCGLCRSGS